MSINFEYDILVDTIFEFQVDHNFSEFNKNIIPLKWHDIIKNKVNRGIIKQTEKRNSFFKKWKEDNKQ